jgi:hypothetical protein
MDFKQWWEEIGSGIRPAISSDMEAHACFVANTAWNAARQITKEAEQASTNTASFQLPLTMESCIEHLRAMWGDIKELLNSSHNKQSPPVKCVRCEVNGVSDFCVECAKIMLKESNAL